MSSNSSQRMFITNPLFNIYTSTLIFSLVIAIVAIIYIYIRPLFPVYVRCWFCDYQTKVPYGNQNCWDCPDCEQYNGFSRDGDYNKPIPAQYDEDLNYWVGCKQDKFWVREEVLCDVCSEKQEEKVRQLASFSCTREKQGDKEASEFCRYIEEFYRLCFTCERKVEQQVREQDNIIWSRLNDSLRSRVFYLQADKHLNSEDSSDDSYRIILSHVFHTVEVISSLCLAIRQIQLDSDQSDLLSVYLLHSTTLHPYLVMLDRYTWQLVVSLILSGMLAKIVLTQKRIRKADFINSVFLLMVLISQCNLFPAFQNGSLLEAAIFIGCHLTSVVCALITRRQNKSNFLFHKRNDVKPAKDDGSPKKCSPINQNFSISSPTNSAINQTTDTQSPTVTTKTREQRTIYKGANVRGVRQEAGPSPNLNYSYTVYKFESCNLGSNNKHGRGGLSRSTSVCSNHSNKSTYAEALSSQTLPEIHERRPGSPLISPSRFTPTSHLNHPVPSVSNHSLFSTPSKQKVPSVSHPSSWNHSSHSAFSLYSRSPTPTVVTQFGATPYSHTQIYRDTHTDRHDVSDHSYRAQTLLHRSDSFKCLRDTNTDIIDDISDNDSVGSQSDIDDDSTSDFTSVSQWCRRSISAQMSDTTRNSTPVHHVTQIKKKSSAKRYKLYPWIMAALVLLLLPSVQLPVFTNGFMLT